MLRVNNKSTEDYFITTVWKLLASAPVTRNFPELSCISMANSSNA